MGTREYLPDALLPGYDALIERLVGMFPGAGVQVIAFTDPHGGIRVSEVAVTFTEDVPSPGFTWIRSRVGDAGVILACEKMILAHGVRDKDIVAAERSFFRRAFTQEPQLVVKD